MRAGNFRRDIKAKAEPLVRGKRAAEKGLEKPFEDGGINGVAMIDDGQLKTGIVGGRQHANGLTGGPVFQGVAGKIREKLPDAVRVACHGVIKRNMRFDGIGPCII
jgi:hypothetical protein